VSVIDLERLEVAGTVTVGGAPVGLAVASGGEVLVIVDRSAGAIRGFDPLSGTLLGEIAVGDGPGDAVIDPVKGTIYVSNAGSGTLKAVPPPGWSAPAGASCALPIREADHPLVGRPMPRFALPDMRTGAVRTIEEWQGKKYIVNFFASW
jgi:hypothetical protein